MCSMEISGILSLWSREMDSMPGLCDGGEGVSLSLMESAKKALGLEGHVLFFLGQIINSLWLKQKERCQIRVSFIN